MSERVRAFFCVFIITSHTHTPARTHTYIQSQPVKCGFLNLTQIPHKPFCGHPICVYFPSRGREGDATFKRTGTFAKKSRGLKYPLAFRWVPDAANPFATNLTHSSPLNRRVVLVELCEFLSSPPPLVRSFLWRFFLFSLLHLNNYLLKIGFQLIWHIFAHQSRYFLTLKGEVFRKGVIRHRQHLRQNYLFKVGS